MLPVMRDPDGFIYYKEEVGGLLMGGFEPVAKPWRVDPIPALPVPAAGRGLGPVRAADDQRHPPHAVPGDGAGEDAAQRPRELHARRQLHPRRGARAARLLRLRRLQLAGIANSGGAGRLIAEWIVGGEPPLDLWDVDIRRFAPFTANRKALAERTGETLGLHYAMRWPRQELRDRAPAAHLAAVRPAGRAGAEFGSKNGWERANYFGRRRAAPPYGLGRRAGCPG
jgi:hypothetical protein